ncbi:hypothetical protein RI054_17g78450 [Pseudoscourfieldia marina]
MASTSSGSSMNPQLSTVNPPAPTPGSRKSFNNSLDALFRRMNSAEVPRFDTVKADLKKAREHILEQARITRIENDHASESNAVVRKQAVMAWEDKPGYLQIGFSKEGSENVWEHIIDRTTLEASDLDAFAVYHVTRIQKNGTEAHIDVKLGVSSGLCGRGPMSLVPDFSTSGLSVHKAVAFRDAVLLTALIDRLDDGEMCTCDALLLIATEIMQQMHMNAAVASLISLSLPFCEEAQGEVTFDSCTLRMRLGESYESMGKPSRAVDVYRELCNIAEEYGDPVTNINVCSCNLGVALRRTGDKKGAVKAYTRALQGEDDNYSIGTQVVRRNLVNAAGMNSPAGMSMLLKMLGGERRVSAALDPAGGGLIESGIDTDSPHGLRAFANMRTRRSRRGDVRSKSKVIYYDDSESEQRVRVAFASDLPWFQATLSMQAKPFGGGGAWELGKGADEDNGAEATEVYGKQAQKEHALPERYTTSCDMCGTESSSLKKCGGCGSRAYCSRECQLSDWKSGGHKQACKGKKEAHPKNMEVAKAA